MKLYHCTTPKKLEKYKKSQCILTPVRGWINIESARNWCKRTGRKIIVEIEVDRAFPLPDHKPFLHAYWTPKMVQLEYTKIIN